MAASDTILVGTNNQQLDPTQIFVTPIGGTRVSLQNIAAQAAGQSVSGNRFALMGDSIMTNGGIAPTGYRTQASNGPGNWLSLLSLQQINIEPNANFSLSGRTSQQIAAQIPNVIAFNPTWCVVEAGTNDPGNGVTLQQSIAALTAIYTQLQAAGIGIIAIPVTPRTGQTPQAYLQYSQMARFTRQYGSANGNFIVADPTYTPLTNYTTMLPSTNMTADGLHPTPMGAYYWGKAIYTAIAPFIATTDVHPVWYNLYDTYDAANNITGNMLSNSLFTTTTGGTLQSTPSGVLTGSVPGSWLGIFSGAGSAYTGTLAITNSVRTDRPGNLFTVTATNLSGTGGGAQDKVQMFQQINFPTGLLPNDVCECMVEIFVNATAGFSGFDCNIGMSDGAGTTSFQTQMGPATNSTQWAQGTYHVVLKTPRMTVGPANGSGQRVIQGFVNAYFDTSATGPATATISLASLSVRKII